MNKLKAILFIPLLMVGCLSIPSDIARAEQSDLRQITPIQVYSLWININSALIYYAQHEGYSEETLRLFENIQVESFAGKIPEDAFNLVGEVITIFSSLSHHETTSHGNSLANLEEEIFSVIRPNNGEVTPSMVFMRSTILLDFIAQDIVGHNRNDIVISPFFDLQEFENKVPSDVFGLVDKAYRRLKILVTAKGGEAGL